jgi:glycosyltransferase involved in cell wall biosynthesis
MDASTPISKPARTVFLLQDLSLGGTQGQALELAHRLDSERFRVELWLLTSTVGDQRLGDETEVPIVRLGRTPNVTPGSFLKLWQRLRRERIDLLVTLTVVPNTWGRVVGRLARVPVIVGTCRLSGTPARQHEGLLWRLADHHICNCVRHADFLKERYGISESRVSVIPNGVDVDFFRPREVDDPDPPVVLCVGRMVPHKGQGALIEAFASVVERYPEAELWMVGDGAHCDRIARLANERLPPDNVRVLPGQADIRPLLQRSSLLVLPSEREGLPNVVLEAMAAGLPVVATDVGGVSEAVAHDETGLLVPAGDTGALASAIVRLLGDEEGRTRLGRSGRERVERHFPVSAMVQAHDDLFTHLLAGRT